MCKVSFFLFALIAWQSTPAQERLAVTADTWQVDLPSKTWLYEDATLAMTAEEVLKMPLNEWKPARFDGFKQTAGWTWMPLIHEGEDTLEAILYLNNPFLHEADLYIAYDKVVQPGVVTTGLSRHTSHKAYRDTNFPMLVKLPPRTRSDILVRSYDPFSTTNTPLFFLSLKRAMDLKDWRMSISYAWLGMVFLSLILALLMYIYVRQSIFIHYALLGLGSAIAISANIGLVWLFVDQDPYQLLNNYYQLGGLLFINFMPRFLNQIVPISKMQPTAWKMVKVIGALTLVVWLLHCIPALKFTYAFSRFTIEYYVNAVSLVFLYLLIILAIASIQRLPKALSLFMVYLVYLGLAFGVLIIPFLGINNQGLNMAYLMVAGSAFETVAFMFLMARSALDVYKERDELNKTVQNNQKILINAIVKSQEAERMRFSQDLHDGFGQLISSLNLYLKRLQAIPEKDISNRLEIFDASANILEEMHQELKNICFNLMPQTLINAGWTKAIEESAARINKGQKIKVSVWIPEQCPSLNQVQEIALYRVSQEWMNNVLKHSDATQMDLQITFDEKELTLMIEDNGSGFHTEDLLNGDGNGWKNIRSRASLIKGSVDIDSQPGSRGTAFIMNIPLSYDIKENQALGITGLGQVSEPIVTQGLST